ncbi:MAG: (2Fe-2S)-binding protein [Desulfatiglandaceae bacterium]
MEEDRKKAQPALTRRHFLAAVGAGAATVVASSHLAAGASTKARVMEPTEMIKIRLRINGRTHRLLVEPRWSLLFVLRERLGLTAVKSGCERGECGACTVLVNDVPRYACMMLAVEMQGADIITLEGLMNGEKLGHVQQAFLEHDAFQCGYCTPGQIVAVEGLLRRNPDPSNQEIREGVSGNLCRCGAYTHIFQAVERAAQLKRGQR